jgi:ABC-type multidrug transport system ATPase subunit
MSVVLQEPLLFSGSVYDNIRYGHLDASEDEIVEAARAANAHDFILRLPDGYQTEIGERGAQLSGGERQRVCVARAFLKDAPILILDEPTSSIDSKTESLILDALERLMVDRTTVMIAHRLSTIRHADLILVLSHGELVEQGSHDELLDRDGLYRQLWTTQIGRRQRAPATQLVAAVPKTRNPAGDAAEAAMWKLVGATARALREQSPDPLYALAQEHVQGNGEAGLASSVALALAAEFDGTSPVSVNGRRYDIDVRQKALVAGEEGQ